MTVGWSLQEQEFIENLKTMTVGDAAEEAGYERSYGGRKLYLMRQKYKKARSIINIYEGWRRYNKRLDKLLTDGSIEDDE